MRYTPTSWKWLKTLAAFAAVCGLAACGGGGGSEGGGTGLVYTGAISQAVLTEANGVALASGAYRGGDLSGSLGGALASTSGGVSQAGPALPRPLAVQAFVDDLLEGAKGNWKSAGAIQTAAVSVPMEVPGPCGGTARYDLLIDEFTGELDGSIRFTNFCRDGVTSNGLVDISGFFDVAGEDFGEVSIFFSSLRVTSPEDSFTMAGSLDVSATVSQNSQTLYMNLLLRDNFTNKVYRMADYLITATAILDYSQVTMSGRFYHPDEGFVQLSTLAPLKIYNEDDWPFDGTLQVVGQGGGVATLTALDEFTYFLEADWEGDSFIDFSEEGPWELL